jgi:hypothetical protein
MPAMRTLFIVLALAACGGDDKKAVDAAVTPPIDAAIDSPDRPVLPLTAQAYCDTIQTTCTGANAQYPDATSCLAAAAKFTPGAASTEKTGDTLGCRIYHAQNAMLGGAPALPIHCPHAGPIGGAVDATAGQCGATPCDDFCNLDAKVCGSDAAPVTGVTKRYATVDACKTACAAFAKTPAYSSATMTGNTFACRVWHLVKASSLTVVGDIDTHCGHTLVASTPCS